MKILKRIVTVFLSLTAAIFVIILLGIGFDEHNTSYLDLEDNDALKINSFLLTNVNIVPMNEDTVLLNKTVYIKDGVISGVDDIIEISDVEIIDGQNKYLTPGLIDMHVHVWDKFELGLYLANGVTAVRNLWGMPMHLRMKEEIENSEIIAPIFFTTSPKLTGPSVMGDDKLRLSSPADAKEKVQSYKLRGYDFIKTYYGLTEEIFDALVQQAELSDMDIVSHPTPEVTYSYHFKEQIKSIEHVEDIVQQALDYKLDTSALNIVVNDLANSRHTSFCPTMTGYHNIYKMLMDDSILTSEDVGYINPLLRKVDSEVQFKRWNTTKLVDSLVVGRIKAQHDFHLYIIGKLHKAGVRIICGTDSGIGITAAGFSMFQELSFYKSAGLSNFEVLKTATVNPSETHEVMNNMGTIQVGKVANLLLLEKNPLEDLNTLQDPVEVFVKGRRLGRDKLDSFEKNAMNRRNIIASALRYVENLLLENFIY